MADSGCFRFRISQRFALARLPLSGNTGVPFDRSPESGPRMYPLQQTLFTLSAVVAMLLEPAWPAAGCLSCCAEASGSKLAQLEAGSAEVTFSGRADQRRRNCCDTAAATLCCRSVSPSCCHRQQTVPASCCCSGPDGTVPALPAADTHHVVFLSPAISSTHTGSSRPVIPNAVRMRFEDSPAAKAVLPARQLLFCIWRT